MTNNEIYQYEAAHILVKSYELANNIYNSLQKNQYLFTSLAKEYSICPSGKTGGYIGYFKKGDMVKEFENAIINNKNKDDTILEPIKSCFGWHIIFSYSKNKSRSRVS